MLSLIQMGPSLEACKITVVLYLSLRIFHQSKQPLSLRVWISELLLYTSYEAANPFCDTYLRLSSALSSLISHLFLELDVIF